MKKKKYYKSTSYPVPDGHPTRHRPRRNFWGIFTKKIHLMKTAIILVLHQTLHCMMQKMNMTLIMNQMVTNN